MAHDTTGSDTADSIETMITKAETIVERCPRLEPLLTEMLREVERCSDDIDEEDAIACMRFHARHPELAETLMHLAHAAREQGFGVGRAREVDDWPEEPTLPA